MDLNFSEKDCVSLGYGFSRIKDLRRPLVTRRVVATCPVIILYECLVARDNPE